MQRILLPSPSKEAEEGVLDAISQIALPYSTRVSCGDDAELPWDIAVCAFVEADEKRSGASSRMIVWSDENHRLAYVNAAFLGSYQYNKHRDALASCDTIIVSDQGISSSDPQKLRMPSMKATRLILSDRSAKKMIWNNQNKVPCDFGNAEYIFD